MNLISVIVPIYNEEENLKRCIESILGQTFTDLELILINDGSTDNSLGICKEYERKDNRVRVIDKKNEGQGIARNLGIDISNGIYIGFVDADDWIEKDMYEKMYNTIIQDDSDIVMCDCIEMFNNEEQATHIELGKNLLENKDIKKELIPNMIGGKTLQDHYENNIPGYVCRCLYTRKIINNTKFISERVILFEDLWFNLNVMINAVKISILNEPLYHYVHYDNSFVRVYKEDLWERQSRLDNLILDFVKKENIYNDVKDRLRVRRLINLFSSINNEIFPENKKTKKEQLKKLKEMCNDKLVIDSLKNTNTGNITLKQKIRYLTIKKGWYKILYYLAKVEYNLKSR